MKKTNRCVVAHEAVVRMGFGAEVAAVVQYQAFDWLDAPIERVGSKFTPIPFAPVMENFVVPARLRRAGGDPEDGAAVASEVILPRLGQGMESGTIVRWLVSEGDKVEKGQPLYELDTDKVTQEVEADAAGVLLKIVVPEGEVPVGTAVALRRRGRGGRPGRRDRHAAVREERRPPSRCRPRRSRSDGRPPEPVSRAAVAAPGTAAGSRRRRSRGGSRASAASTSPRCPAPGPEGRIVAEDVERARSRPRRPKALPRAPRPPREARSSASS